MVQKPKKGKMPELFSEIVEIRSKDQQIDSSCRNAKRPNLLICQSVHSGAWRSNKIDRLAADRLTDMPLRGHTISNLLLFPAKTFQDTMDFHVYFSLGLNCKTISSFSIILAMSKILNVGIPISPPCLPVNSYVNYTFCIQILNRLLILTLIRSRINHVTIIRNTGFLLITLIYFASVTKTSNSSN